MREYDLIADWYPSDRGRTVGVAEALAVAATFPAHSRILDIGCGNGVPITEALVNAGHRVVGLDSSAGMLDRFRANLPGTPVVRGDARQCPFGDRTFDAAFSWGMLFHLRRVDQAAAFASVSRVLEAGAPFTSEGKLVPKPNGYEDEKLTPRYPAFAGRASRTAGRHSNASVTHRFL